MARADHIVTNSILTLISILVVFANFNLAALSLSPNEQIYFALENCFAFLIFFSADSEV